MVYYVLLFFTIALLSGQSIIQKQYNIEFCEVKNSNYLYNFCMTLVACLVFFIIFIVSPTVNVGSIVYSVLFAITFCVVVFFQFLAIKTGPLALTALVISFSLLIPIVYGLIFLDENLSVYGIVGISALVLSLVLVNEYKKEEIKITKKYVFYLILAFLGNGFCTTFQKMHQIVFDGKFGGFFMFVAMAMVALFNLVMFLVKKPNKQANFYSKGSMIAGTAGLFNGLCNCLMVILATKLPSTVLYPTVCSGNMILLFLVALLIYHEKFKWYQCFGYALGLIAIILLNI